MKNFFLEVCFFLILSLGIPIFGQSIESLDEDSPFYAISSLRFFLEEKLNPLRVQSEESQIVFEEENIDTLWTLALNSSRSEEMSLALEYYREALTQSTYESFEELLSRSKTVLDNTWEDLNVGFFQKNVILPNTLNFFGDRVKKYLLPTGHYLKPLLDQIFIHPNILSNESTLKSAGFSLLFKQSSGMIIASHPLLKGYLIKLYPYSVNKTNFKWMLDRCEGAENIRTLIKEKNLKYFEVPDKWIYCFPGSPIEGGGVLVVTNMNLVTKEESKRAWKNKITPAHLEELFCILCHGFASCYLPYNIPYTKNGKFACIDTEYPKRKHHLEKPRGHFSDEMRLHWDHLVKSGGNQCFTQ